MSWEALRTPQERFDRLPDHPFPPHYVEVDGLRIHYVDEGAGPPVLLFHGEPTWSFLYRKVVPPLVDAGFRAIAIDAPGFGRSDKPVDPAFYTYDRLVASMHAVCDELRLEDATAVVQDWGGPIGLRIATERPEEFRRLVIMNTGLFSGTSPPGPGFLAWRSFVERTEDLPIGTIMRNAAVADWPEAVVAGYEAPFPDPASKVGARRLPLIVPLRPEDPGAREMLEVRTRLGEWTRPALVLFSTEDPIFPVRVGERWAARVPGAGPLELVPGAGHFLQEDRGEDVAAHIVAFLVRTA